MGKGEGAKGISWCEKKAYTTAKTVFAFQHNIPI